MSDKEVFERVFKDGGYRYSPDNKDNARAWFTKGRESQADRIARLEWENAFATGAAYDLHARLMSEHQRRCPHHNQQQDECWVCSEIRVLKNHLDLNFRPRVLTPHEKGGSHG